MQKHIIKYLLALCLVIVAFSCMKEEFNTSPDARLTFSTDTIFFDTVFTNVGSTTAYLQIYNPYDENIKINSIGLGMGDMSPYRMNVNGLSGSKVKDVELAPKDSLFVLVEVTINPNNINAPFVVQDSIVCNINGAMQDIKLMAWGQNAHYIDGRYNGIVQTETWTDDKPYLIYNSMLVDSLHTLTIKEGTKVYLHKGAHFMVKGTLDIQGTYENPVIIQGDRLEENYQDIPGQWGNIILADGSGDHKVEWAVVKNGVIGFQVGSTDALDSPTLTLKNTKIQNMDYAGIFAMASTIKAQSCLISNAGTYLTALLVGGKYNFKQCTFANYWTHARRSEPSVIISDNFITQDGTFVGTMEQANFSNCIIYGDTENEIGISSLGETDLSYHFKNTLYKKSDNFIINTDSFENCIKNKDPKFIDQYGYKFELDTLSPAKDRGDIQVAQDAGFDLNNQSYLEDLLPDLGAYECQE